MEFFTHALASYAMARVFFPRVSQIATASIVLAGTAADLDTLSAQFSPAAFLQINHTWGHSLLSAGAIILISGTCCLLIEKRFGVTQTSSTVIFAATASAAAFHLLLDMCQSAGVVLLWPFTMRRFAADWLPPVDIWIILILLAGLILPLLFGMVTDEIGVKSKAIRGRREAAASLLIVAFYISLRMLTHAEATFTLLSRSYAGNLPRATAALPVSQSPFRWLGTVETESAWHLLDLAVAPAGAVKIVADHTYYKPEDSVALATALNTPAAKQFLQHARFPKAGVGKNEFGGTRVTLREVVADHYSNIPLVLAVVDLDRMGNVQQEELAWDSSAK